MSFAEVDDLKLVEIQYPGQANYERIVISVLKFCDLAEYCMFLTMPTTDGTSVPVKDHMLWFGHGSVNPGDWVIVYTGSGSTTIIPHGPLVAGGAIQSRLINIHWGKDHTIFQNRALTPALVKIGGVGGMPQPTPQYQGRVDKKETPRLF